MDSERRPARRPAPAAAGSEDSTPQAWACQLARTPALHGHAPVCRHGVQAPQCTPSASSPPTTAGTREITVDNDPHADILLGRKQ